MTHACFLLVCLGGNIYADFFAQGNAAYASGAMEDAVGSYGRLVDSGVENASLFYNLGNAYYHLGDLGRAVLNYERATGLEPDFDLAQRALALVVEETEHGLARPPGFTLVGHGDSWIPGVPQRVLRWGAAGLWCLLWGILAATQWRCRRVRPGLAAAAGMGLLLCMAGMAARRPHPRAAVVLDAAAPARYGPDTLDAVRTTLAPGDRVLVDRFEPGWLRVETEDGMRGWVEEHSLGFVGPPFALVITERDTVSP
jgi:hypothetical protein